MAKTYNRGEVEQLLGALEQSATAVVKSAGAANGASKDLLRPYQDFRQRCDDFDTLSILIEHRLKNMKSGREKDLEHTFDELTLFLLAATLAASLHFLKPMAERDTLPLGSRDLFTRELKYLQRAEVKMSSPAYAGRISDKTKADVKTAEELLGVLLDRAPVLMDFGRHEQ